MRVLVTLVPLLVLAAALWVVYERSRLSARERAEISNLRAFKDVVRDAAITEVEIDSSSSLARIILDEVRQVDRAGSVRKDLP
jgi:hypothetical protein